MKNVCLSRDKGTLPFSLPYKVFPILLLIYITFLTHGNCQFPMFYYPQTGFGSPAVPGFPYAQPSLFETDTKLMHLWKEFPPGVLEQENISFTIRTGNPIRILISLMDKKGHLFLFEAVAQDSDQDYSIQGDRIILFEGSEKINDQWQTWDIYSIDEILATTGEDFGFIAKIDIIAEEICLGAIIAFSEDESGVRETSYLASFNEERETLGDYGWHCSAPLQFYYNFSNENNPVVDEGYICLERDQSTWRNQFQKVPITFIAPSEWGYGALFPVTIQKQAPLPISPPFIYPSPYALYNLSAQLYSTPINPLLALNITQSIPQYLNAQIGLPYSIKNNTIQPDGTLPQYPTRIDFSTDPAYTYLILNDTL